MDQAEADGVLSPEEGGYVQAFSIPNRPGELAFNCPRITHVNGASAADLTRCQILGRRRIRNVIEFCRRYLRGFDDAYLAWTAPMVGVRETRRIVGEYVLTAEEIQHNPSSLRPHSDATQTDFFTGGHITRPSQDTPGQYRDRGGGRRNSQRFTSVHILPRHGFVSFSVVF